MSGYHDVYAAWKQDPEAFWANAAKESTGTSPGTRCSIPMPASMAAGSPARSATPATTASTATSSAGAAEQKALIYDSPVTEHEADASPTPSCATRWRRSPACCRTSASSKGDRVIIYMPMMPEAVIGDAGLRAHRRRPFGGVRRLRRHELATRIDDCQADADPRRPRAASSPAASSQYKPLLDSAIELCDAQAARCPDAAAAAGRGDDGRRPRPRLGRARSPTPSARPQGRLRAGQGDRPALHPLHLGHDRPAQGRGARQRRPHGGAQVDDEEPSTASIPARRSGRPPTSAGWWAIPTSSTRRCCTAAPRSSTRASRSARPMPAPSGA